MFRVILLVLVVMSCPAPVYAGELEDVKAELRFVKSQYEALGVEAMRIIKDVELQNEILRNQLAISEKVKKEFIHKYINEYSANRSK